MKYGMSDELGPILYGSEHSSDEVFLGRDFNSERNYSEETASLIDREIKRIITEAYDRAEKILREHRSKMDFIAEYLVKNEVMDDRQFEAVMNGEPTIEELEEMVAEKKRISEEENAKRAEHLRELEKRREAERAEREARERSAQNPQNRPPQGPNPWVFPEPPMPPKNDADGKPDVPKPDGNNGTDSGNGDDSGSDEN